MSTSSKGIDSSPSSLSFSTSKVSVLSKFVVEELDKVEELLEAAKRAMEQVFVEINEARMKLNYLLIMQDQHYHQQQSKRGQGGGDEHQTSQTEDHLRLSLKELNEKVSHFKSLIPYSLLVVKKDQHPPSDSSSSSRLPSSPPPPRLEHPPKFDVNGPPEPLVLSFLLAFPDNTFIKRSLLHRILETVILTRTTPEKLLGEYKDCNIIERVLKRDTNSVAGYLVNPLARTFLEKRLVSVGQHSDVHITGNIDNDEIIYRDPVKFSEAALRQSTYWAEIDDLHLSFTCVCVSSFSKYLSLRGNSTMEELPNCITKLDELQTLDLGDCQNLVVIPSKIADLGGSLTYLDMSECYSLVHMPPALAQLHELRVLKGFVINKQTNNNIIQKKDATCTLKNLAQGLTKLEKLKIYANVVRFPNGSDLATLRKFEALSKLTISWEGYSTTTTSISSSSVGHRPKSFFPGDDDDADDDDGDDNDSSDFKLEKLDLQCAPSGISYTWLKPANFPNLKKLYIRGGKLDDLRQRPQHEDEKKISCVSSHHHVKRGEWRVETLRLKYLKKLKIDWNETRSIFPELHSLQIVDCPSLTSFPTDDSELHKAMEQLRRDRG